jgi:hypothetical protein
VCFFKILYFYKMGDFFVFMGIFVVNGGENPIFFEKVEEKNKTAVRGERGICSDKHGTTGGGTEWYNGVTNRKEEHGGGK